MSDSTSMVFFSMVVLIFHRANLLLIKSSKDLSPIKKNKEKWDTYGLRIFSHLVTHLLFTKALIISQKVPCSDGFLFNNYWVHEKKNWRETKHLSQNYDNLKTYSSHSGIELYMSSWGVWTDTFQLKGKRPFALFVPL